MAIEYAIPTTNLRREGVGSLAKAVRGSGINNWQNDYQNFYHTLDDDCCPYTVAGFTFRQLKSREAVEIYHIHSDTLDQRQKPLIQ